MDVTVIVISAGGALASWAGVWVAARSFKASSEAMRQATSQEQIAATIRIAVLELKGEITESIARDYRTVPACLDIMHRQDERIDRLQARSEAAERYSHRWKHKLSNVLTGLVHAIASLAPEQHHVHSILEDATRSIREG